MVDSLGQRVFSNSDSTDGYQLNGTQSLNVKLTFPH